MISEQDRNFAGQS